MAPWVKWPTSKSRSAYYLLTVCGHFVERFYDDVRGQRYFEKIMRMPEAMRHFMFLACLM